MKPITINPKERYNRAWTPARRVWFQKNKDFMVYNDQGDETVCRGHDEARSCKRTMRSSGKTGIHSYEWDGED